MPPLRYFHQLLTQQGTPAEVYYIRGKSTAASETFTVTFINDGSATASAAETITVTVDANGNWEYSYSGKKIYSLKTAWQNNATISEIEITEDFTVCNSLESTFWGSHITKVSFPNAILGSLATMSDAFRASAIQEFSAPYATFESGMIRRMFYQATSLTTLNLPAATFNGANDASAMFSGCTSMARVYLPQAIFGNCTNTANMFASMTSCTEIELPEATFENATNVNQMFPGGSSFGSLKLPKATFNSATSVGLTFLGTYLPTIELPEATFKNATNVNQMFHSGRMTALKLPKASFEKVTTWNQCLLSCTSLTTIEVPASSIAIALTATSPNFTFQWSPLNYQSMLNIANWVKDFTGYTQQTVTFKTSAWNALTAAEQANIDSILTAKNWTRALA